MVHFGLPSCDRMLHRSVMESLLYIDYTTKYIILTIPSWVTAWATKKQRTLKGVVRLSQWHKIEKCKIIHFVSKQRAK